MDNPYSKYLDSEFDEMALLREEHNLLVEGDMEGAKKVAMKLEAVVYVKQSLKKVDYELQRAGHSRNTGEEETA